MERYLSAANRANLSFMESEETQPENKVGEMRKRRETMPDGKRYIIFYTFGDEETKPQNEEKKNV